jgi:hypothetical protein
MLSLTSVSVELPSSAPPDPQLRVVQGEHLLVALTPAGGGQPTLSIPKATVFGVALGDDNISLPEDAVLSLELWARGFDGPDARLGALPLAPLLGGAAAGAVAKAEWRLDGAADDDAPALLSFEYALLAGRPAGDALEPKLLAAIVHGDETAPTGQARLDFRSGNAYAGGVAGNMMEGKGSFEWKALQIKYAGDFAANRLTGSGTYEWPDGSTYTGEVKDGLRHGTGSFKAGAGAPSYEGEWRAGKRSGEGTLRYDADGASRYSGQWEGDRKHGRGVMVYASGSVYDGEWEADAKHGKGVMSWKEKRERYEGEWKGGKQHGHGEHVWLKLQVEGSPFQMRERYAAQLCRNSARDSAQFGAIL